MVLVIFFRDVDLDRRMIESILLQIGSLVLYHALEFRDDSEESMPETSVDRRERLGFRRFARRPSHSS